MDFYYKPIADVESFSKLWLNLKPKIMPVRENVVADSAIDLALEHLENMTDQELNNLFERMSIQQPNIMGFVVGLSEGLEDEEAAEDLFYLTTIIWHSVELSKNDVLLTVSEEALTALENRMTNLFEEIISFSEENDEDDMKNLIGASSQPSLVSYLADEFFSEQYLRLPEEKIAKMFACMTVVGESLGEA